jgi:hypothetical protein
MAIYSLLGYANQQPDADAVVDEAKASMLWREAPQDQKISVVQNSMNPLLHVD